MSTETILLYIELYGELKETLGHIKAIDYSVKELEEYTTYVKAVLSRIRRELEHATRS